MSNNRLKITEIFLSLQGETRNVGLLTAFVRLTGCPLRCQYCDTSYAFTGGEWFEIDSILEQLAEYGVKHVVVTGGEPLAQKSCISLLSALCDAHYQVMLETSGAIDISAVDPRVITVMDIKTPGSGEADSNRLENIKLLAHKDQIKFVICDQDDYVWAKALMQERKLQEICEVLFSPSAGQISETALADMIIEDRLPVRFQIQLHKKLWGDIPGK